MFDFVHQNKRLVQVVLVLIILPFAFWGMDSYNKAVSSEALAKVDGEKISQLDFDQALREQQNRMREILGGKYDQAMFDNPEIKRSILDGLISQRVLISNARSSGLTISDEQLTRAIAGIETFNNNGQFDRRLYEATLRSQNMTPEIFESRVYQELITQQLTNAYKQNGYASRAVVDNIMHLNEQQRVISVALVSPDLFLKSANVDEAVVKAYYEKNQSEFKVNEQVRVEYLIFTAAGLQAGIKVSDEEIKKYYEERQREFGDQEQRQAAHILISVNASATESDKQMAKAKIEKILQQVRQSPGKFSELAKQYSQDTGSAANGGDLGMFAPGAMVKPFEEAVFKLKTGEISDVVQTDFGFHIIKLLAVKPGNIQPLSVARNTILDRLNQKKASDKFAELAEKFSSTVYEQSDTLKSAADLVQIPLQQSAWLNKGQPEALPWTDKALQAVFTEDVLSNKRNSAVVEIEPDKLLAARLLEFRPASVRPLVEVSEEIHQKLLRQQALKSAVAQGKSLLEKLKRGDKVNLPWKPALTVTREKYDGLDNTLARKVFQAKTTHLPAYVGVENETLGYFLARVDSVKDIADIDDNKRTRYLQQLHQLTGEELFQAFLADTKKHADIEISTIKADNSN